MHWAWVFAVLSHTVQVAIENIYIETRGVFFLGGMRVRGWWAVIG